MTCRNLLAAASLTASLAVAGYAFAEDPRPTGDAKNDAKNTVIKPSDIPLPAGVVGKDLNEQSDLRSSLASYVNSVLTKDDADDMVDHYVDQDRVRLAKLDDMDSTAYDGRVEDILKKWKAKYNEDFKATPEVFENFVVIREGEVADPVAVRAAFPVAPISSTPLTDEQKKMNRDDSARREAEAKANADAQAKNDATPPDNSDANLDKGRNVAIVAIPGSHGMPTVYLSMVHELPDSWVIDLPNKIDDKGLQAALLNALTVTGEMNAEWPADKAEAYRAVAHAVVIATLGEKIDPHAHHAPGEHEHDHKDGM